MPNLVAISLPAPPMPIVATVCGRTAAGGTVAMQENGVGFSRRCIVRRIVIVIPRHPVPARVAKVKRVLNSKVATLAFW